MLYLLSSLNLKLRPMLLDQLAPGTPIVSHDFDMGDWKPDKEETIQVGGASHRVFLWTVPAKASGKWQLKPGPQGKTYSLMLVQNFDDVSGKLSTNGREYEIISGSLHGKNLTLDFYGDGGRFEGIIDGPLMRGKLTRAGSTLSAGGKRIGGNTVASAQQ
jgi:hypothetical protein